MDLSRWLNIPLLSHPMNWGVTFVIATIWLLALHVVMQAWAALMVGPQQAFGGPGQLAAPLPDVTSVFSQPGSLFGPGDSDTNDTSWFQSGGRAGASNWTDNVVARYAEDGWTGNG